MTTARSFALVALASLLVAACGGKEPDCVALADHIAEIPRSRAPADTQEDYDRRMRTVREGYYQSCKDGHLTSGDIDCYNAAKTEEAFEICSRAELDRALGK
jgi:hypothetical protein